MRKPDFGYEVEMRREGKAIFYSPKLPPRKDFAPTSLPVFFNPVSKPNRDMTILFLAARYEGRSLRICDALAGTGVRSIRIALETDVAEEIVANDISAKACELMKLNVKLNGVEDLVRISCLDANELLAQCGRGKPRYDYVDIDPAGSPAPFIENGLRGCGRKAVLGATSTDMPALAGAKPEACLRKYDAKPLRSPFSKEIALRILAGFIIRSAARLGLAATPILSFSKDHYVRVFVEVDRGRKLANEKLAQVGWISYCPGCAKIYAVGRSEMPKSSCELCGKPIDHAGPAWIGELTNGELASEMLSKALESPELYRESLKLLKALSLEDHGLLGYFPVNVLARVLKRPPVKPSSLIQGLRELGYRASITHIDPSGVKTNAPLEDLKHMFEELGAKI